MGRLRRLCVVLVSLAAPAPVAAQTVEGWLDGTYGPACVIWGWARDSSAAAPIQVRVYSGGDAASGTLVTTVLADRLRPDLQFPDRHHGFEHVFTADEIDRGGFTVGSRPLHLYAVGHDGSVRPLSNNGLTLDCASGHATITVDFSAPLAVRSASGFLLDLPFSGPGSKRVPPMQPRYWRFTDVFIGGTNYPFTEAFRQLRAASPTLTLDFLMSNLWGYPIDKWHSGTRAAPWLNWPAYEAFVRTVAQSYRSAGMDAIIEVWNEPDYPDFWNGTRAQFFETYLRTYRILRTELGPDVAIAGPSFAFYDRGAIEAFLDYCLVNGCEVNALTWHALDDGPDAIGALAARVQDARVSFLQNPKYASLRMQRIDINEIVGPTYTYQPAGTLAHYDAVERSGADAAAHACWNDTDGSSGCLNRTINGLLTPGTYEPRAAWWLHKAYADGVASRVRTSVENHQAGLGAVAVASRTLNHAPVPQVLVGYVDFARTVSNARGQLGVQLRFEHLEALSTVASMPAITLHVERIPATGPSPLPAPVFVQRVLVPRVGASARVDLPPLSVGEVFRITIVGGAFADDPLVAGTTPIRAAHLEELRVRIDALRTRGGLPLVAWDDGQVAAGTTMVRARHIQQMREALTELYAAFKRLAPQWQDEVGSGTVIRARHITELRVAVLALEEG